MKKIDTWLDIQKYVAEASRAAQTLPRVEDIEVVSVVRGRKSRRQFLKVKRITV